jgi:patatin-like phospholipase/acyl hydrolase
MAQVSTTAPQEQAHGAASKGEELCLLSLDGGGVRGLSSLQILKQLMELIDPKNPPKPCDYFDMIGGTSTGGLIAIMLGRLRLTVDECIDEYKKLSDKVFTKLHHRVKVNGNTQGRFDHEALVVGVQDLLERKGLSKDELLKDDSKDSCKT